MNSAHYLSFFYNGDEPITWQTIVSGLAWGLGYCGMPHILVRFMAVKDEKELKKSQCIGIIWVVISLTLAISIGIIGRAYMMPEILGQNGTSTETVFINIIEKLFADHLNLPFIGGFFICGILAAIMSTADSQLLVCSSSISTDLYKRFVNPKADDQKILNIGRIATFAVAILAFFIAWDPNSSIMGLVSDAWAGLGAAFGPLVLMSLFWERTNLQGAIAGLVSGAATVIIWDYLPLVGGNTIGNVTGLYSLIIGFVVSLLFIVVVSLATKAPDELILKQFEEYKNYKEK